MPLKLSVGLSKKVGLPHYGSLGASCQVEVELEGSLLRADPDGFHRHARNAFLACRQAVLDELARNDPGPSSGEDNGAICVEHPRAVASNGQHASECNGNGDLGTPASAKQLEFARQLAGQIRGIGIRRLEALCAQFYEKPLAALTGSEASQLIDKLKAVKSGKLDLAALQVAQAA